MHTWIQLRRCTCYIFVVFYGTIGHAQTCVTGIAASKPTSRYVVSGATVTDQRTGLMWDKCSWGQSGIACETDAPNAYYSWQQALAIAATANSAQHRGYTDWRLPNIREMQSLVETCRSYPSINDETFPNAPGSRFWSASPAAYTAGSSWILDFYSGNSRPQDRVDLYSVRLVCVGR